MQEFEQTEENKQCCPEMADKMNDIQQKMSEGINKAMNTAGESLDKTAESIRKTASFFKEKNADTIREDISNTIKKYPAQTLLGAAFIGFLFGKLISR